MGVVPTLPPVVDAAASKWVEGSAARPIEAIPKVTREEAEQPLLTLEEVVANLSTSDTKATEKSTEKEDENLTERVNKVIDGTKGRKKSTPRDEAAQARAATVHIYERRSARAEASKKKTTEEPHNKAPENKQRGVMRGKKEVLWSHHDTGEDLFWLMSQT